MDGPSYVVHANHLIDNFNGIISDFADRLSLIAGGGQTVAGAITFSSSSTFSAGFSAAGTVSLSGTVNLTNHANFARAGDQGSPVEGDIWYNSTTHLPKFYNGTSALTLATTAAIAGILTKSANYTALAADGGFLINCTSTFTLALTAAATLGSKWYCYVMNSGTGVITIDANSTETTDGLLIVTLGPGNGCLLLCDGTAFYTVGRKPELVVIQDQKTTNTAGGTSVATTWTTSVLNTLVKDTGGVCTLASNQFILTPGTYEIEANKQAFNAGTFQIKLYNITDSATAIVGSNAQANNGGNNTAVSHLAGPLTITANKTFEIQYWASTGTATNGLGPAVNSAEIAVFTTVKIKKVI